MVLGVIYVVVPVLIALGLVRKYRESSWGKCKENYSLQDKVFIVTGANSGIGKETVKGLAVREARIIMACRDIKKAEETIKELRKSVASGELIPMQIDLTSLKSVETFAQEVLKGFPQIHALINNAGVSVPHVNNEKTQDGFEINFGVNHLSHFLLTNLLLDRLKRSAPSRVIIVSSTLHQQGVVDFDNLNGEKGFQHQKGRNPAYCNSKLANAYFCQQLAQRMSGSGVEAYVVCPGFCYTGLFRNSSVKWYHYVVFLPVAFFFMRSAAQGSQTVLHCALSETVKGTSGQFYRDCKAYKSSHDFRPEIGQKLWEVSDKFVSEYLKTSQ